MEQNTFDVLLDKYLTGDLSPEEQQQLAILIEQPGNAQQLEHFVQQVMVSGNYEEDLPPEIKDRLNQFLTPHIETPVRRLSIHRRWIAAAAMIIAISTSTWLFQQRRHNNSNSEHTTTVLPGTNKATLTLSDGQIIALDTSSNTITDKNGIKIINLPSGQLSYQVSPTLYPPLSDPQIAHNTLTTPRGGQYQLTLFDGTKVWLNAASSITYPTVFDGPTREVTVTGEVYMEVAADKSKPFIVQAREMNVEVLGTHFNINAYTDEPAIQTTLLEGSIRVSHGAPVIRHLSSVILKPGEQATFTPGAALRLTQADAGQVVAWKNGVFQFNRSSLPVVLRQLSRWYDMDIVYQGKVPDLHVGGKMQRNLPLKDALDVLKRVGVQFKINGNKLIVME